MNITRYLTRSLSLPKEEAIKLISEGRVLIDEFPARTNQTIKKQNEVKLDGKILQFKQNFKYYAFNKPRGVLSAFYSESGSNLSDYFSKDLNLFPCGRLDKESEGLMLISNDGQFYNRICGNGHKVEKTYMVWTNAELSDNSLDLIRNGMPLGGNQTCLPARIVKIDERLYEIKLKQGLYRQIRRMMDKNKVEVLRLLRIATGKYNLGGLEPGNFIEIDSKEVL